jgi:hypothetical protein
MATKTGEPTTSNANPAPDALLGYFGSLSAVGWWRRWPIHGGRGKTAGGYQAAASHVGFCVFCVVVFCAGPYFWLTDM